MAGDERFQARVERGWTAEEVISCSLSIGNGPGGGVDLSWEGLYENCEITLPDQLAEQAYHAGFLAPEALKEMLREKLRTKALDEWFKTLSPDGEDEPGYMSPEDVAEEIAVMRAERRAASHAG